MIVCNTDSILTLILSLTTNLTVTLIPTLPMTLNPRPNPKPQPQPLLINERPHGCSFEDEGAKDRTAKLEEENTALQERLAKALEVAARSSSVGSTALAASVGNGATCVLTLTLNPLLTLTLPQA